ncbi:hypothetical protein HELRODRAFT_108901 [Helobdella robusta]|uniref:GPR158/179 extracellular domain-containing protein n=1 Tax=Helobdella robusta TaxID=6412 RepID=T1EEN6_HELRO|nr:hypothetical protein HELRODRAFT_108901 [Helobdella robusta]ESO11626.1 hypothetical protein HELRODRAFT_108901 [Helobdella robusta]
MFATNILSGSLITRTKKNGNSCSDAVTASLVAITFTALAFLALTSTVVDGQISKKKNFLHAYDWLTYDKFDEIDDRMNSVNAQNCKSKSASELRLPRDSVAQPPMFNRLLSYIVYPNRTKLLHTHNMALNRAFFYSYIFQRLDTNITFPMQPGLLYYYFSAVADVTANPNNINASGIFFDKNSSFATWYRTLPFNNTIPLFGPRAYRFDDFNEPTNWIREPTNKTINVEDYGAGSQNNYTLNTYKINQWYDLFLPDKWTDKGEDSKKKYQYSVGVKYSNQTGKFTQDVFDTMTLFGPPSPGQLDETHLPVLFTEPYFDCGRSNRWIVSAVAPVIDHIPRYLDWIHLRRMTYVAVTTMDMEFLSIDFNPCPRSIGNQPINQQSSDYLTNVARCKPSTICEPLYGWGFRRGGYKCMCKPGYRYPPWQYGPFMGIEIESATYIEYENGFDCIPVELRQVIPVIRSNDTKGTPNFDINYMGKRKKRSVQLGDDEDSKDGDDEIVADEDKKNDDDDEDDDEDDDSYEDAAANKLGETYGRLHNARKTDRSVIKVPDHILQSRILNKKLRLLRMFNLKETTSYKKEESSSEEKVTKTTKVVPRVSHPYHLQSVTNKKIAFVPRFDKESVKRRRMKRQAFDEKQYNRMQQILNFKTSVTGGNCKQFKKDELILPGDVGYNVEVLFSNQARTALRLSHFLSNFMQNVDKYEEYGNLRGDRPLNIEQIFGEVLANTMGDLKMKGSGVFFDLNKFVEPNGKTRELFGPYAYKFEKAPDPSNPQSNVANTNFRAVDYAGFPTSYLDEPWFKNVKERWQSNTYGLSKFREKLVIRSDVNGTSQVSFLLYPMYFQAPMEEDGLWSVPYFKCDGYIDDWIITYSVPFFGFNSVGTAIEFKGVVTVDVMLNELDINQCPQDYFVPNAFKDTARCHYETTYCVYIAGKKFITGGYKCDCKVGYEYPFNDNAWYFDGQTVEEEYRKKVTGDKQTRYDNLQCRIAGSSKLSSSTFLIFTVFILIYQFIF